MSQQKRAHTYCNKGEYITEDALAFIDADTFLNSINLSFIKQN